MRRQLVGVALLSEDTEHVVQFGHGMATGGLDRGEGFLCMYGLRRQDVSCGPGLDTHDADMVGDDDVMQLASDPHPFLEDGATGILLSLALQFGGAANQFTLVFEPCPCVDPERPEHGDYRQVEQLWEFTR